MDWIAIVGVLGFFLFRGLMNYAYENPEKEVSVKGAVKVSKGIGKGVLWLIGIVLAIGLLVLVGMLMVWALPFLLALAAVLIIIFLAKVLL